MRRVQALLSYCLEEAGTFRSSSERARETFKTDTRVGSPQIQRDRYSGGLLNFSTPFSVVKTKLRCRHELSPPLKGLAIDLCQQ